MGTYRGGADHNNSTAGNDAPDTAQGHGDSPQAGSGGLNQAVGSPFESSDVDALHLHHRLKGPLGAGRIGITE